jgi:pimeloyl-ACP methyl ester carboxylesterase
VPKKSNIQGEHIIQTSLGIVRFRVEGSGPQDVIFCPDAPAMLEHHDELFRIRPKQFRFISIEPMGTGFSIPNDRFDYSFDQFASNLIDVIDMIGATESIFATGCTNAYFALLIADKRPDLINNLILWQAPNWDQQAQFVKDWIDPQGDLRGSEGPEHYKKNRYSASRWWFDISSGPCVNHEEMAETTHRVFDDGGCQCLAELVHSILTQPKPAFKPIDQNTTILWCDSDRTQQKNSPETLLELVPNGKIIRWPDAGHLPDVEFPQKIIELVETF